MTNELKPCMKCGSDNVTTITMVYFVEGFERYYATCYDCGCTVGLMDEGDGRAGAYFDTEAEAIAAWNTRTERTCEVISSYYYDNYDQYEFEFSCGHSVNMYDKEPPAFCPSCGRKVVTA